MTKRQNVSKFSFLIRLIICFVSVSMMCWGKIDQCCRNSGKRQKKTQCVSPCQLGETCITNRCHFLVQFLRLTGRSVASFGMSLSRKIDGGYILSLFNPLHPNISMHILHTFIYTFPKVLTSRICLAIGSLMVLLWFLVVSSFKVVYA